MQGSSEVDPLERKKLLTSTDGYQTLANLLSLVFNVVESQRLRHIPTPTKPVLDGLCRFWGLGKGDAERAFWVSVPEIKTPRRQFTLQKSSPGLGPPLNRAALNA